MMKKYLITFLVGLCAVTALQAKPGIKSIVVFGDSLSDAGNSALWADRYADLTDPDLIVDPSLIPIFPEPYYENRASNGPTWIEIAAEAYGFRVDPALEGGMNFAFSGAESGTGFSDQFTPNFRAQIRLYRMALQRELLEPPMPWQLFVVSFGPDDVVRALLEAEQPIDPEVFVPELVQMVVSNIAQGILSLHEMEARMFLVANMPPLHLTPYGQSLEPEVQALIAGIVDAFNTRLEMALTRIENANRKVKILRLDVAGLYAAITADPATYGLVNVDAPALDLDTGEVVENPNEYFSWDGYHPTVAVHALFAQAAMDIIPIGSWWGHSVARGPGGAAWLGMGWVNDEHWPWVFSYNLEEGVWMWAYEEGGTADGFYAFIPKGYKWIFINSMSGWYYDYEAAMWKMIEP